MSHTHTHCMPTSCAIRANKNKTTRHAVFRLLTIMDPSTPPPTEQKSLCLSESSDLAILRKRVLSPWYQHYLKMRPLSGDSEYLPEDYVIQTVKGYAQPLEQSAFVSIRQLFRASAPNAKQSPVLVPLIKEYEPALLNAINRVTAPVSYTKEIRDLCNDSNNDASTPNNKRKRAHIVIEEDSPLFQLVETLVEDKKQIDEWTAQCAVLETQLKKLRSNINERKHTVNQRLASVMNSM